MVAQLWMHNMPLPCTYLEDPNVKLYAVYILYSSSNLFLMPLFFGFSLFKIFFIQYISIIFILSKLLHITDKEKWAQSPTLPKKQRAPD